MKASTYREITKKGALFLAFLIVFFSASDDVIRKCDQHLREYIDLGGHDPGFNWLFVGWLRIVLSFVPSHQVSGFDLFQFQAVIMAVLSILMLLPRVPLLVSIGGQISLLVTWCIYGEFLQAAVYPELGAPLSSHGIEAWTVILGAMFMASLAWYTGSRRDYLVTVAFGIVLGYCPLIRQSALQVPAACIFVLGVGAIAAVITIFLRRKTKGGTDVSADCEISSEETELCHGRSEWAFCRLAKPLLCILVVFFVVRFGAHTLWSAVQEKPWFDHGSGSPVLASLGVVGNPYNVVWDDDWQLAQLWILDKKPVSVVEEQGAEGQRRLGELGRSFWVEDPALAIQCIFWRAWYLVRYFSGTLNSLATQADGYPIGPSWFTLVLGLGFCAAAIRLVVLLIRCPSDRMLFLTAGSLGLFLATVGPLVLIGCFYTGCAIAVCLALWLILWPAANGVAREDFERRIISQWQRNTFVCYAIASLILAGIVSLSVYTWYRAVVNRQEARELLKGGPGDLMLTFHELGHRFRSRFNRLSETDQQLVIDRMLAPTFQGEVFRSGRTGSDEAGGIFTPVVAVIHDGSMFVVARLSRAWRMLVPSRVQGPRNSVLEVARNADRGLARVPYWTGVCNYHKIPDGSWDGRYRMFTLPAPPEAVQGAQFFGVSAYNYKDGADDPNGLVLDLISGGRLYRSDLPTP